MNATTNSTAKTKRITVELTEEELGALVAFGVAHGQRSIAGQARAAMKWGLNAWQDAGSPKLGTQARRPHLPEARPGAANPSNPDGPEAA